MCVCKIHTHLHAYRMHKITGYEHEQSDPVNLSVCDIIMEKGLQSALHVAREALALRCFVSNHKHRRICRIGVSVTRHGFWPMITCESTILHCYWSPEGKTPRSYLFAIYFLYKILA